jgi:hypothetical protein
MDVAEKVQLLFHGFRGLTGRSESLTYGVLEVTILTHPANLAHLVKSIFQDVPVVGVDD